MLRSFPAVVLVTVCAFLSTQFVGAQFANAYVHLMSDDHTAVVQSIAKKHYIQASTTMGATKDIHLMKIDAGGNVVLDKIFFSPSGNEVALDVCRGNNHTYLICGYEQVGVLDLGFVLQVDTNFNFVAKVNIQVPGNNRHTPALNIINSAFYQQPNPNLYFPPDPAGGYLITGFEAVGYNPTDPKSGYALKLTDALTFQWMAKLDSPIPLGSPDWDMCSHGTYMWVGAKSYFVGGSGTSPTGGQVAMATEISMSGALMWTKIYHDTNVAGHTSVAAAAAFDDQPVPMELYQITNHSLVQGGGFITFEQGTGNIIFPKTRHIVTSTPGYYLYEFGSTCASSTVLISGYGHNQTAGSTTGFFPFTFRYDKTLNQLVDPAIKYAYPVQSPGYNPNTTIYDSYQTGGHPRIFYPKLFGQLGVNEMTMAAFEDIGTEQENYVVHPNMNGGNACDSIDPGFVSTPINIIEGPANHQLDTFVVTPGTYTDAPLASTVQVCNNCTVDPNFTISPGAACNYTFTANSPGFCPLFTVYDIANNVLFTANAGTANYTFGTNGTYTICYSDCGVGTNGVVCRDSLCQTIQVNCPPPCPLDADFTFNVSGCCASFQDLTPDGNPGGCEYWTFGNIQVTMAGDITSFCFPGSGTYTVCHVDCCTDASGVTTYHQVCKQVTVSCTPPCCLPTGINITTSNCCISASPILPGGCTGSNFYYWTLSNGNFSTQANPTFCSLGTGFYTICLWAYCGKGNWTKFCKTVKVSCALPPPPPGGGGGTAKFSYNLNGTTIGLTPSPPPANLQITSHTWTFGDGQTSTAAAPSHYYLRSGSYPITHSVEGIDLGTGMPFTAEQTVQVTMALAPACGCVPPELDAMAGGELVCDGDNTVLLKLIDFASESDIEHQWMRSTCSGAGCPTSQFVEVPGAIGQHVWIDDVPTTSYFRCRSTSSLGFVTWSNEVEVTQGEFTLQLSGPPGPVCPADSVALVATGAAEYAWSNGATGASILARPPVTTTYSVDGTNTAGCMAGAEVSVVVDGTGCEADVQVRMLLEGPLNSATALMNDALRAGGLVPLTEPYTALGYAWPPGSSGSSTTAPVLAVTGPDAVVDWVLVELRDPARPEVVLATRSALLQRDGDVVDVDGTSALRFTVGEGGYLVAVLHRNHLAVMAANPSTLGSAPAVLDLSSPTVATFGTDARKAVGAPPTIMVLWMGDVNFDDLIRYSGGQNDRDPVLFVIGGSTPTNTVSGYRSEDVNMDGTVKYTGENNDRDPILLNIGGSVPTNVKVGSVP